MREARLQRKSEKPVKNDDKKPIIYLTGHEKTGFDCWNPVRKTFRPINKNELCKQIELEIVQNDIWNNIAEIKKILRNYARIKFI